MKIRFGYVAMCLSLENSSPSKTVTVANINKLQEFETRLNKLRRLAAENISNTLRILKFNLAHDIFVFRITSKLVPLATFPDFLDWDYISDLKGLLKDTGDFAKKHGMRISAHPDHFTLINSPDERVFEASLRDLLYHEAIFDAMGLGDSILVMHIGGLYKAREASLGRFKQNFALLPHSIRRRIALENDDKSYSIKDVLPVCQDLGIPMVLDFHHHCCCNKGEQLKEFLPAIFQTWKGSRPKIHISSPKSEKLFRHHADDIDITDFKNFLDVAKDLDMDFDVMIEAKNKDLALFKLMKELSNVKGIKLINQAEIEV